MALHAGSTAVRPHTLASHTGLLGPSHPGLRGSIMPWTRHIPTPTDSSRLRCTMMRVRPLTPAAESTGPCRNHGRARLRLSVSSPCQEASPKASCVLCRRLSTRRSPRSRRCWPGEPACPRTRARTARPSRSTLVPRSGGDSSPRPGSVPTRIDANLNRFASGPSCCRAGSAGPSRSQSATTSRGSPGGGV